MNQQNDAATRVDVKALVHRICDSAVQAATERMSCGHVKADWTANECSHCLADETSTKSLNPKYAFDHLEGELFVDTCIGFCRVCVEIQTAYERGVSDGIEFVAWSRTNNE